MMAADKMAWPDQAESVFAGQMLETLQQELEKRFPGRGVNLFVHMLLLGGSELFHRLEQEEQLADIMNAGFQSRKLPWRLVRAS